MTLDTIEVGSLVRLKGHSLSLAVPTVNMVVTGFVATTAGPKIEVCWLDVSGAPHRECYPADCLTAVGM